MRFVEIYKSCKLYIPVLDRVKVVLDESVLHLLARLLHPRVGCNGANHAKVVAHQRGRVKLAAAAAVDLVAWTSGQPLFSFSESICHLEAKDTHLATGFPGNDDPCTHVPAW